MPGQFNRYNMKRSVNLTANISGEDLGAVAGHIEHALKRLGAPPKGATVDVRGQIAPLNEILLGLSIGLVMSIVVILLLLTANFQSVKLALVVVSTTPAVVAGVVLMLWATGTTVNLQSFMGAIMALGVAVANAILLVTFAEQHRREERMASDKAAIEGARGRLRPILMTSCAMIAGMVPMAVGWSEAGEQTAPLARAVIGGLAAATLATLVALPTVFAFVQGTATRESASLDPDDPASPHYYEEEAEFGPPSGQSANGGPLAPQDQRPADSPGIPASPQSGLRNLMGLIIAATVLVVTGCEQAAHKKTDHQAQAVMRVEVVKPERRTVQRSVNEPGQLVAVETTPIHAKIDGYVHKVNVDIGYDIKKGQVLAELSVPEVEADLQEKRAAVGQAEARRAQAEAAVEVAQAAVASAEARVVEVRAGIKRADADLTRWQQEYRRVEQLFQERAQTGTLLDETRNKLRGAEASRDEVGAQVKSAEAALRESRSELDKARADVVAATASIEVARAEVRHAEAMLGYTRIEAPYDGIVTRRLVDTGHLTKPGSDGEPLFVVARTDVITIAVDIPETDSTDVNPGDHAIVKLQAMKGRTVEGKVTRTAWALDPKTRTIRAEIDIPNPDGKLRPGLYVYATVILEEHPNVLTIPTTAVFQEKDQAFCVIVADGKARRLPIVTGLNDGTRIEVTSGLQGSEDVVKASAASLVEGQPVAAARPEAQPAPAESAALKGAKP
jgi:RND family efflux transporter MFP subunit